MTKAPNQAVYVVIFTFAFTKLVEVTTKIFFLLNKYKSMNVHLK